MNTIDLATPSADDPAEIQPRLWKGWSGNQAFYVGANCGQNFPHLADLGFSSVFAFEPNPASFAVAQRRASEHNNRNDYLPLIRALPVAISDHDGWLDLALLLNTVQHRTGQYVTPRTSGMEWEPSSWDDPATVRYDRVSCITLDSASANLGSPDLVIIDTEGHEFLILQGAGRLITSTTPPGFLIEFHTPDNHDNCSKILSSHGYTVETVRHPHYPLHSKMWYQHGWIRAIHHS